MANLTHFSFTLKINYIKLLAPFKLTRFMKQENMKRMHKKHENTKTLGRWDAYFH